MKEIAGCQIVDTLYQGRCSVIYRGAKDGNTYVIKVPSTPSAETKLVHEFHIGQRINSEYVVKFLELKLDCVFGHILIEEDDKAETLLHVIPTGGFLPLSFLSIATQLAEGLQHIHESNVIHKDIKPANIIIIRESGRIKYIDFNSASLLRNTQQPLMPNTVATTEATIAYISPELTGRINRRMDYRTDFYSLGVTFYHLLCGKLPFTAKNVAELVHCHLAKQPSSPHDFRPVVPKVLSDIVMKLMHKNAESRYQSAFGLLVDLRRCLEEFCRTGNMEPFQLAEQDVPEFFCIPGKLYGRESEISALSQACDRIGQGSSEVIFIAGAAGAGKSAVAQEMIPIMTSKGGFFLMGKYETLKSQYPYNGIVQALQAWIQQVLALGNDEIEKWKTKLLNELGNQGQLIVDILPELEFIIGQQAPSPCLDSEQSKMRFQFVFHRFITALASQSSPVLIFLDDMQWADPASLRLLEYLMSSPGIRYLLLVATYRIGEKEDEPQVKKTAAAIEKAGVPVQTIHLQPLCLATVNQWTADTMRSTIEETLPLSVVIYQKTAGYPFFIRVFMQSLYDQGLLTQVGGHWKWTLETIRGLPVTENLIGYLVQQMQKLLPVTHEILKFASCVGHRFTLSKMSQLMERSQENLQPELSTLVEKGLLLQNEEYYWFTHDRVQEAVLQELEHQKMAAIHLRIGRMLKKDPKQLSEAVGHLNRAKEFIWEESELVELAKLNLEVGKKSKQRIAYACALNYLHEARNCVVTIDIWKIDYPLAKQLFKELTDVEHLNSNYEASSKYAEMILQNTQDVMDKLDMYSLLIVHHTVRGLYQEAIEIGTQALKLLGMEFDVTQIDTIGPSELERVKKKIQNLHIQSLINAPQMTNSSALMTMRILDNMLVPAYFVNQVLHEFFVAKMVDTTLVYGNSSATPMAFITFSITLAYRWNQVNEGHSLALLAIQMSEKSQEPVNLCKTYTTYAGFIQHWKQPLDIVETYLNKALQLGEESGEYQYAAYAIGIKATLLYVLAIPLTNLEKQIMGFLKVPYSRFNKIVQAQLQSFMLIIINLTGHTAAPTLFSFNDQTDREHLIRWKQGHQLGVVAVYFSCKAEILFMYQEMEACMEALTEAQDYIDVVPGVMTIPFYYLYSSLAMLALYPTATSDTQILYLGKLEDYENQLKSMAERCPENNLHKLLLIQAERSRIFSNDRWETIDKYEQAIQATQKNGSLKDQAITNELAANFFMSQNKASCAKGFLQTAFHCYERWGATRKVNMMLRQHGEALKPSAPNLSSFSVSGNEETISANSLRLLDLTTILKTSQTISSEVDLRNLLTKILNMLISSAGAQRGSFFMLENEDLLVKAEYSPDGQIQTLRHLPLYQWEGGARSIVDYVRRTQKPVMLSNASTDRRFSQDPYMRDKCVQSVLCSPILRHEKLKAILYLENNLAPHVFSEQHMQILTLLGVQIAISLENAMYCDSIKSLNERLSLAMHSGNVATWCWHIQSNKLVWDEHLYKLLGIRKEEFDETYEGFTKFVHPDDVPLVEEATKRSLVDHCPYSTEFRMINKDQEIRALESVGKVICDCSGQPELFVGAVRDVTKRKQLEQDRLQALSDAEEKERKRAEEAEKYRTNLENFINQICHEIRNPMCGIFGNVDLSQTTLVTMKNCIGTLPENPRSSLMENWQRLEECLTQIHQCVKHQKAIVDDVLDLSKLESSQTSLATTAFSLKSIIQEVSQMFAAPMAIKDLSQLVHLPPEDPWILGDPRRLKIALTNIISNAVKFTQEGGITISLEIQESTSEYVQFAIIVEDTGIGMTLEEQTHLFQRFACIAAAQFEGSGLGLYISKRFVECMGGKIEVQSEKGQGSKFSIHLRLKTASVGREAHFLQVPEAPPSQTTRHILVVEDNEVNQRILRRQLEAAGHKCEVAGNGIEALDKWSNGSNSFDLIFMDVEMPVMGGLEATQIIRKREKELGTPHKTIIIGLSAYASPEFVQQAHAAGMDDYITKPYEKKNIYHAISKCCEKDPRKRVNENTMEEHCCKLTRVDL